MSGVYSSDWKCIPIVPTSDEILNVDISSRYELRKIITKGAYPSVDTYLDILFKLLREDMISPLRAGITKFLNGDESFARELYLYKKVRINQILGNHKEGIIYKIILDYNDTRLIDWRRSERLKYGTLLCIIPTYNGLPTFDTILWGVVAISDVATIKKNRSLFIKFQKGYEPRFELGFEYLIIESREVYFEAYVHTLTVLQNMNPKTLPMSDVILGNAKTASPLKYLDKETTYNFSDIFPRPHCLKVLSCLPVYQSCFDTNQYTAFRLALTKQLALIQGPPGTGKTYLGAHIMKVLLQTRNMLIKTNCNHLNKSEAKLYNSLCRQPILIVTYTNHALDQFLMYLLEFEENIIRIGERTEIEKIKNMTLAKVRFNRKSKYRHLIDECNELKYQMDSIKNLICDASARLARINFERLSKQDIKSVANETQVNNLFRNMNYMRVLTESKRIIKFWLGDLSVEELRREKFLLSKNQKYFRRYPHLTNYNKYVALVDASKKISYDDIEEIAASNQMLQSQLINVGLIDEKYSVDNIADSNLLPSASIDSITNELNNMKISDDNDDDNDDDDDDDDNNDNDNDNDDNSHHRTSDANHNKTLSCIHSISYSGDLVDGNNNAYDIPFKPSEVFEKLTLDKVVSCMIAENKPPIDSNNIPDSITNCTDVWKLNTQERKVLYNNWAQLRRTQLHSIVDGYSCQYSKLSQQLLELYAGIDSSILNSTAIIGMTTTGAAKYSNLLKNVEPRIIFVEEAAEILEAHTIACLSQNIEHLILIGDHQQLRPSNAVYQLAKDYNLNLSLFERLINNEVEHVTLNCQHRMRPEISALIEPIYPLIENHCSVLNRDNIKGVLHNIYFIDHCFAEDPQGNYSTTRKNTHEAKFIAKLALYFVNQGYSEDEITILTFYLGQKFLIQDFLFKYLESRDNVIKTTTASKINVVTVDKFQGEENTIVIFSIVRSNVNNKIGFCQVDNRVCVALSRARDGFFVVGNASCLREASKVTESQLWGKVLDRFENKISKFLPLCCQNHSNTITLVSNADDFSKVTHGGCKLKCGKRMPCGHDCVLNCHPYSHEIVKCYEVCQRKLKCGHLCSQNQSSKHSCYQECPSCQVTILKDIEICGHTMHLHCSVRPEHSLCVNPCKKTLLLCGHNCPGKCNEPCESKACTVKINRTLVCGHSIKTACSMDTNKLKCNVFLECGHICHGKLTVNQFYEFGCNEVCNKVLPCGHACKEKCHNFMCGPCEEDCRRICRHTICKKLCGEPCHICFNDWKWKCPHYSYLANCNKPFYKTCNHRCQEELECGHQCKGFCGDLCPNICDICYPEDDNLKNYFGTESNHDAIFMVLDCEHIFEVTGLEKWFNEQFKWQNSDIKVQFPCCPKCNTPMLTSCRYSYSVLFTMWDLEKIKLKYCNKFQQLLISDCDSFSRILTKKNTPNVRCIYNYVSKIRKQLYDRSIIKNGIKLKIIQQLLQMLADTSIQPLHLWSSSIAHQRLIDISENNFKDNIILNILNNKYRLRDCIKKMKDLKILMRKCKLIFQFDILLSSLSQSNNKHRVLCLKSEFLSGLNEKNLYFINNLAEFETELNNLMLYNCISPGISSFIFRRPDDTHKGDWYKCSQHHVYKAKLNKDGHPIKCCPDCSNDYI